MQKKYFIFRNVTIENLFSKFDAAYSGYGDISYIPDNVDAYLWFYLSPIKTNAEVYVQEVEAYIQQLQLVLSQIKPQKVCYAFTMYNMHFVFRENSSFAMNAAIQNYNKKVFELSEMYPNLKIIDFARFCKQYPASNLIDWRFYYISQMQINPKLAGEFNVWLQKEISTIEGKRKKCLVLDLDNTLWGGILGEDGIEGIQIGNTYPGSAFLDFQNNLRELLKSGVILTVCSKNNEQDVVEAWNKNPFLQIKKEQLAAWRINWNNKADNIAELAQELNIGLDSMVFIDDNPTERELVKQMHLMVEVPEFPKQPYMLRDFFEKICTDYFQIYKTTNEDKEKLEQYKANAERTSFQQSFASLNDYLKSLEIVLDIQELNSMNLSRIAQMTQKTNQFNLTTKRYTEEDISTFASQGAKIFCISVSDKFGDSGITGAIIVMIDKQNKTADIDSFLLSCRILGKNIEIVFLKYVLQQLKTNGILQVMATFVPTAKNKQVSDFYETNNFLLTSTDINESKHYSCVLANMDLQIADLYSIKD
jgi:FkbH-like protein